MSYTINKEEIRKIAAELGLQVKFNSETPGVLNTVTGEITPLSTYLECLPDTKQEEKEQEESIR